MRVSGIERNPAGHMLAQAAACSARLASMPPGERSAEICAETTAVAVCGLVLAGQSFAMCATVAYANAQSGEEEDGPATVEYAVA